MQSCYSCGGISFFFRRIASWNSIWNFLPRQIHSEISSGIYSEIVARLFLAYFLFLPPFLRILLQEQPQVFLTIFFSKHLPEHVTEPFCIAIDVLFRLIRNFATIPLSTPQEKKNLSQILTAISGDLYYQPQTFPDVISRGTPRAVENSVRNGRKSE